jgi:predicted nucleotidyltransferase
MTDLFLAARDVQNALERRGWGFCFIGGVAVQCWGQPRLTKDLDLSLLTGFGPEEQFLDEMLQDFEPRIPDFKEFSLRRRVALMKTRDGLGIDVALAGLPFEERVVMRARMLEPVPGVRLRVCGPEDLIILKVFAGRPIDLQDVRGVLVRQAKNVDLKLVERELQELDEVALEDLVDRLRQVRKSVKA